MAGNIPMSIPKKAQEGILEFQRQCYALQNQNWNIREQLQLMDRLYQRELDLTKENRRAKLANRYGDSSRFQNITIPVVLPQVEAAVTYQSSVFLTGTPMFGVVASPQFMDEALQLETILDSQAVRGGWARELMMFFRDGFKYNLSAVEISWAREVTAALETSIGAGSNSVKTKETIWEGNRLKRWDMYNTFFDMRVLPTEMHTKGEFVGTTELMSRVALKSFIAALPDKMVENLIPAFESGLGSPTAAGTGSGIESYFIPEVNPDAVLSRNFGISTNWLAWAGLGGTDNKIQYKDAYEVTTLYARIIPSDFGLKVPAPNTPQVWKFIFVNHQILIYAERQTNAHGWIPVLFGQPNEDGLGYQTKSLIQNVEPIQSITSALSNSIIHSRRRALSDRTLYDPSRVDSKHINNDNPSAKIPVKPSAYGKNVSDAVYAFPYRDDQASVATQEISMFSRMADMISGQNPVKQGQFVKGNKTKSEFADVMANANGRDQLCSILYENQIFAPAKVILKTNILQFQGGVSLYNREKARQVDIDPVKLRKAIMEFKVSDGLTPSDKLIGADTFQTAIQVIGSSQQLQQEYNLGPMFSYFMKTQNAYISEFEKTNEQKAYEQALAAWQNTVVMIYEKSPEINPEQLPPQPKPEEYGYNPAGNTNAPEAQTQGEVQ